MLRPTALVFRLTLSASLTLGLPLLAQKEPAAPAAQEEALDWAPVQGKLMTKWAAQVSPNPLPEYPRPQLVRDEWQNLNGLWSYAITPLGYRQAEGIVAATARRDRDVDDHEAR